MKQPIPEIAKEEIVRLWLAGWQRDSIAGALNLGAGTVSNTISEWKEQIGAPTAVALRKLGTELRRQKMTVLQCADAFRFLNQMKNADLTIEEVMPYIVEILKKCLSSGVSAGKIFGVCRQIFELDTPVPIVKLPELISKEIETNQNLEKDITTLRNAKEELQNECSDLFVRSGKTVSELKKYQETQNRLGQYGKSLNDVNEVVRIIDNFKGYNYSLGEIVNDLGETRNCRRKLADIQKEVTDSQRSLDRIQHEYEILERKLASGTQELEVCNELEKYRIFLSDLIVLRNKVIEIAQANVDRDDQIFNPSGAFKKFLNDVETQYDPMIGFEMKLQELQLSQKRAEQEYNSFMKEYSKRRDIYDKVEKLFDLGRKPSDILLINDIFMMSGVEPRRIEVDLKLYGNLLKTLDELKLKVNKLGSECYIRLARVNSLKLQEERISKKVKSIVQQQDLIESEFKEDMNRELTLFAKGIRKMNIESSNIVEQIKSKRLALEAEEREKMDQFRKINATLELSPLLEAARGNEVDGEGLRAAASKAIELVKPRLNPEYHESTIKALEAALISLKSEFIIF